MHLRTYVVLRGLFGCVFCINVEYSVNTMSWHRLSRPLLEVTAGVDLGLSLREGFKGCSARRVHWTGYTGAASSGHRVPSGGNVSERGWACHYRGRRWACHSNEVAGRRHSSYPESGTPSSSVARKPPPL